MQSWDRQNRTNRRFSSMTPQFGKVTLRGDSQDHHITDRNVSRDTSLVDYRTSTSAETLNTKLSPNSVYTFHSTNYFFSNISLDHISQYFSERKCFKNVRS